MRGVAVGERRSYNSSSATRRRNSMRWKRWLLVATALALNLTFFAASEARACATDPTIRVREIQRCPEQMVCFTIREAAEIDARLIELQADLERVKLKKLRRFGFTLGCGAGVGPAFSTGAITAELNASCGAFWGFRFN